MTGRKKTEETAKGLDDLLEEIDKERMMETIRWMVENTPYRLAGSADEARAAAYVTQRMKDCGMEVVNEEIYTYNSDPLESEVEVLQPVRMKADSLPCAHIRATKPEGEEFELVYAADGSYDSYRDMDVRGKMVLVEVSYAPPVPEKGRIAAEMGAAGIMCMNWGNDEEVICHRGLKAVWGNPTEETFGGIPDITGVGVTRGAGLKLKELCLSGQTVIVRVKALADRKWSMVHQPYGIIRGNGASSEFILVGSHIDAWKPGVTCNATGNATTLELCRVLSERRELLDRDIHVVFWNGHEIAEAAGSTWFVDHYWKELSESCAAFVNIDSTGVGETKLLEIKTSDELFRFSRENAEAAGETDTRIMTLKKIGDQSFMGIGVPSVAQRISFTQEDMDRAHGATLGWWNHTKEDGIDKCDPDILYQDTLIHARFLFELATAKELPYEFERKFGTIRRNLTPVVESCGGLVDLSGVAEGLARAEQLVLTVQNKAAGIEPEKIPEYNKFMMLVSRNLTNIFQTYADKYQQDSYGNTRLSSPVPLLCDISRLLRLEKNSLEYGLVETQVIKNRNRMIDGLNTICDFAELYDMIL